MIHNAIMFVKGVLLLWPAVNSWHYKPSGNWRDDLPSFEYTMHDCCLSFEKQWWGNRTLFIIYFLNYLIQKAVTVHQYNERPDFFAYHVKSFHLMDLRPCKCSEVSFGSVDEILSKCGSNINCFHRQNAVDLVVKFR